jgi:uncharacterized protein
MEASEEFLNNLNHLKQYLEPVPTDALLSPLLPTPQSAGVNIVNIIPSLACNLRCSYCYAEDAIAAGKNIRLLSLDVASKLLTKILTENGGPKASHVLFRFTGGGEPLINFKAVRDVTRFITQELTTYFNFRPAFRISTNGTLLSDETLQFFKEYGFWIKISLDGNREDHNQHRGEYEKSLNGAKKALDMLGPDRVTVAFTYTRDNINLVERIEYLSQLGFKHVRFQLAVHPLYYIKEEDFGYFENSLFKAYEFFVSQLLCRDMSQVTFLDKCAAYIAQVAKQEPKGTPCLAGEQDFTIAPDGKIYSCNRLALNQDYEAVTGKASCLQAEVNLQEISPTCAACWARAYCSGYCHFALHTLGSATEFPPKSMCFYLKTHLECAIWAISKLNESRPDIVARIATIPQF